ncbi:hypothetical protein DMUE_4598 [Dictyocoela muelleri]|nr:hypothetical protein DMUE_4598 [Dictyocoela muelleri]
MFLCLLFLIFTVHGYITLIEIEESPQVTLEKYSLNILINSSKHYKTIVQYLKYVNVDSAVLFSKNKGGLSVIDKNGILSDYNSENPNTKWMFIYFMHKHEIINLKKIYENEIDKIISLGNNKVNSKDTNKQSKTILHFLMPIWQLSQNNNYILGSKSNISEEKSNERNIIHDNNIQDPNIGSHSENFKYLPSNQLHKFQENIKRRLNIEPKINNSSNNFNYFRPVEIQILQICPNCGFNLFSTVELNKPGNLSTGYSDNNHNQLRGSLTILNESDINEMN